MEARVGIGLNLRFRYEENDAFRSENQEEFARIRHHFSLLFDTFTDSFTDSDCSETGTNVHSVELRRPLIGVEVCDETGDVRGQRI